MTARIRKSPGWLTTVLGLAFGAAVGGAYFMIPSAPREPAESESTAAAVEEPPPAPPAAASRPPPPPRPPQRPARPAPAAEVADEPVRKTTVGVVAAGSYEQMRDALRKYDDRALGQIPRPLGAALRADAAYHCGVVQAAKHHRAWAFVDNVLVDLKLDGTSAQVTEIGFGAPPEALVGGTEFQTCFARAVVGTQMKCVDCKAGTLSIVHPVAMSFEPSPSQEE